MGQVQGQNIVPSGWFIVTGASGSVGGEVVKGLAARGYAVILACRNPERGRRTADAVLREVPGARLRIELLDLSSSSSIRDFVSRIGGLEISGLLNNAGSIFRDYALTPEGRDEGTDRGHSSKAWIPGRSRQHDICNCLSFTSFRC